jgi:hypothetical protein
MLFLLVIDEDGPFITGSSGENKGIGAVSVGEKGQKKAAP